MREQRCCTCLFRRQRALPQAQKQLEAARVNPVNNFGGSRIADRPRSQRTFASKVELIQQWQQRFDRPGWRKPSDAFICSGEERFLLGFVVCKKRSAVSRCAIEVVMERPPRDTEFYGESINANAWLAIARKRGQSGL